MSAPIPPELLTDVQVSALLGISRRLVWTLAEQGALPPVRIRTCTRWRRADVLRYIDGLAPGAEGASHE